MSKKYNATTVDVLRAKAKTVLRNKYWMLWMHRYSFPELTRQQSRFILKQYYEEGTVGCFTIPHTEDLAFCRYLTQGYDFYHEPKVIRFVPFEHVPYLRETKNFTVDKDCAIGWANSTRNSIKSIVEYFVDKMANLEVILNTNISLQNMPFFVGLTPESKLKAHDMIEKLLNGEPVIFGEISDIQAIQAIVTNAPFVGDKLRSLYYDYENQLYTILGVDNTKMDASNKQFQLTEELDANIAEVNAFANDFDSCMQEFIDDINKTFGKNLTFKVNLVKADSLYDQDEEGKKQPGGKEDEE